MHNFILRLKLISFLGQIAGCYMTNVPNPLAVTYIDRALDAVGGEAALSALEGITYHTPSIYRSRSLMQSYEMDRADTAIAVSGRQNMSFKYRDDYGSVDAAIRQRVDRVFKPSDYWTWNSPSLDSLDFSLVVRDSEQDGFACYVKGNDQIWLPTELASGYTDSAFAAFLNSFDDKDELTAFIQIKSDPDVTASECEINSVQHQSVFSPSLNLTLMLHPTSFQPYIVRSYETHPIYGTSNNDLYLTEYAHVAGDNSSLLFPTHIQTVYNSTNHALDAVLEDFYVKTVTLNPNFATGFFDGLGVNESSMGPKVPPKAIKGISNAMISEFSSNMIWAGPHNTTVDNIKSRMPVRDLPGLHWLILDDGLLGVKQTVFEFDNEVIVGDAPPQWTLLVIEWIKRHINKPITHVFPTHHHRDHTGGVPAYVAIGAKIIAPAMSEAYWSLIPGAQIVTFNSTHPYVHNPASSNLQVHFRWEDHATHAADWAYAFATTRCPGHESPAAVFEADAWNPGVGKEYNDQVLMRQWLDTLSRDRVPRNTLVLPTHGQVRPVADMVKVVGLPYPDYRTDSGVRRTDACEHRHR